MCEYAIHQKIKESTLAFLYTLHPLNQKMCTFYKQNRVRVQQLVYYLREWDVSVAIPPIYS